MSVLKVNDIVEATTNGANYRNPRIVVTYNGFNSSILSSTNVSSVVYVASGRYGVNFTNAMSTPFYYAASVNCYHETAWENLIAMSYAGAIPHTRTTTNCNMNGYESGYGDTGSVGLMCVGEFE